MTQVKVIRNKKDDSKYELSEKSDVKIKRWKQCNKKIKDKSHQKKGKTKQKNMQKMLW